LSKASRRRPQTTRGAAARPTGAAPSGTTPAAPAATPGAAPVDLPAGAPSATGGETAPSRVAANGPASTRAGATRPSSSRAGGTSRPRRSLYQPSFYERHRTALLGGVVAVVVLVVGAFLFFRVTASAYACTTQTEPAPVGTPLPNGSPAPLGQAQPDMGNLHIAVGSNQRYSYCPPASGPHYNNSGVDGPIPAKYYGPDDGTKPEGWIHNLEHGGVVILYNCSMGACTDATATTLQTLAANFPNSPICGIKAGGITAPVIARFDSMATPFAALVWDRVLLLNTLDTAKILEFYKTEGEQTDPEPQCARPTASPSAAPSTSVAPSSSVAPSTAPSSSAAPSSSPSDVPSSSPSGAPTAAPSPSAS